jgi:uncharacterized iron-regulated protein
MLTASELLSATKASKFKDWIKSCEKNQKEVSKLANKEFQSELQNRLNEFMTALGNRQMSTAQLAEKLGWKVETTRSRADILMRQNKIRRTTGLQPFLYFKV